MHLSGLLGSPIVARDGGSVGKVDDVIVRLGDPEAYPAVTGLVAGVGGRKVFIPAECIDVPAAELVHAYDVELEDNGTGWVLARLDTRRPARFFGLIRSTEGQASRDWKSFEPLIGHNQTSEVRRLGGRVHTLKPAQIADLLEDANKHEGGDILERVHSDPELEADVFEELDPDKATRLLGDMTDEEVAAVLGRMRADDAADTPAGLRPQVRRR